MKKSILVAACLAAMGAATQLSAAGSGSSSNCWIADTDEACATSITYNGGTCNLNPSGSMKPKVKQAASGGSGKQLTKRPSESNCKYIGATCGLNGVTPSGQQGNVPDGASANCTQN